MGNLENVVYEDVPEFFESSNQEVEEQEEIAKIYYSYKNIRIENLDEIEKDLLKKEIKQPSKIINEQSYAIVNFEGYQGYMSKELAEFNALYQNFNNWGEDSFFNILEYYSQSDIYSILKKIAYLPNNKYLSKAVEMLVIEVINGNIEFGNIIQFESTFQSFKRIYDERIQLILIPFLLHLYALDKKLIPIKRTIWNIFNKNSRNLEAYLLMADIQRSNIRMKKAQEFLIQEGYNLQEKVDYNINLMILISDKNYIFHNIFKIFKEIEENTEIQGINEIKEAYINKKTIEYFQIKTVTPKPLTQQLLVYKTNEIGNFIAKSLSINILSLEDVMSDLIVAIDKVNNINYFNSIIIRDIVLSTTDFLKKKNITISEIIKHIFISIIKHISKNNSNNLKVLAYLLGYEITLGVFKVKYKIEEAIFGISEGIKYLKNDYFLDSNKDELYNILIEFTHGGYWEASVEIHPNITLVEKNSNLFFYLLKD
ncbi:MAG: hypothetical protein AABZ74_14705 [Cyanobacteriota bacterium]